MIPARLIQKHPNKSCIPSRDITVTYLHKCTLLLMDEWLKRDFHNGVFHRQMVEIFRRFKMPAGTDRSIFPPVAFWFCDILLVWVHKCIPLPPPECFIWYFIEAALLLLHVICHLPCPPATSNAAKWIVEASDIDSYLNKTLSTSQKLDR